MKARNNPFRSERVEALRYRSEDFSWEKLEARLVALGGRGAIVGPRGQGKTTLLLEWAGRCRAAGQEIALLRLRERQGFLDAPQRSVWRSCAGARVFIDNTEQLVFPGWLEVRWRARQARSLVVTTHRSGKLLALHACRTSPELLDELVEELAGSGASHRALWQKYRGHIRDALRELYGTCAG